MLDKNDGHNRKEDAATALVKAFLPYIRKRASRIESVGLAYDDIVQEGLIGLLNAVGSFEGGRGASFETYAITCIIFIGYAILLTYSNVSDWEEKAKSLAAKYIKNFEQYTDTEAGKALIAAGPKL